MERSRRTWARAAVWVTWLAALFVVPGVLAWVSVQTGLQEGWGAPRPSFWASLPWSSAIPLSLVAAAMGYALRDRLARHWRRLVAAGALALIAYLVVVALFEWRVGASALRFALMLVERPLRYGAWFLWGLALPMWVLRTCEPERTDAPRSSLDGVPGAEGLTAREREIAEALVTGSTQAQVAEALGISPSTVSTYRARACEKLGVVSLEELAPREWGASAPPPVIGVTSSAACPLMAGALCLGLALQLAVAAAGASYLTPAARGLRVLLCLVLLAVPWIGLCVYGRFAGLRLRRRESSLELRLVLGALATFGLLAGDGQGVWVELPGHLGIEVSALALVGHAIAVAALAPYVMSPLEREATELDEERCVLYLRGRGAGELQARVLTEIALGRSAPEICEALHVARGTVNAYRAQGYELLGVHSSKELEGLLARDEGRVPSAGKNAPSAEDSATSA